jgi:flagellin
MVGQKAKDWPLNLSRRGYMIINHNMSAAYSSRVMNERSQAVQGDIQKLSSGMRINSAGDDASGLAVSEKLRAQVRGLNQASQNVQNAVSFIQTTEGYLNESGEILHRIRELAVQSSNGIYTAEDRMQIQVEVSQLVAEVNRVASHAQFNGMNMLTGAFAKDSAVKRIMQFHVGANMDQNVRVFIGTMTAKSLGLIDAQGSAGTMSISSPESANASIGMIDTALKIVNKQRADLGAYQNRLQTAQKGIDIAAENLQASESRIRDSDMAKEMVEYVKNQILTNSSSSMLAQANTQNQSVMKLLG